MSSQSSIIAIDLMGGDESPLTRWRAINQYLKQHPQHAFKVFLDQKHVQQQAEVYAQCPANIELIPTEASIMMDESPILALRHKRTSSLSMAIRAVADGEADAVLTAGNSGALVALAKYWLKMSATIERPALATVLPGLPKPTLLLDIGAMLEYRAEDLYALAELGAQAAPVLLNCGDRPEVALLNVGTEHIKGHDTVQQADRLLQESGLNYLGFCEGTHLFKGFADVVCCDGFVGNITLKACEGLMQHCRPVQPAACIVHVCEPVQWLLQGSGLRHRPGLSTHPGNDPPSLVWQMTVVG
jgi:glycerol-3-phosphate acyltransferase PlsX